MLAWSKASRTWSNKLGTVAIMLISHSVSELLELGRRPTSGSIDRARNESGIVYNVGVAVEVASLSLIVVHIFLLPGMSPSF